MLRVGAGLEHLLAVGAQRLVGRLRFVGRGRIRGPLGRQLAPFPKNPLLPSAIHEAQISVPVDLEDPEGEGGEQVVVVAVEDERSR